MTEDKKFLDARKRASEIKKLYAADPRNESFNLLLLGEMGSGKTFLVRTARRPIHIDSFDPGGTKGLRDEIAKGYIIADTRWEAEDPENPKMFETWRREFQSRVREDYFNYIGTYLLDSSTFWAEAIMNHILKAAGIAGSPPRWSHDYVPQKTEIRNWTRKCLALPCDFIMTGHLESAKDEVSGQIMYRYMTTGKAQVIIPSLFDEVWVMDPKKTADGVDYRILTRATGRHLARSRLAKEGLLSTYEKPDLREILKKAGYKYEDKQLLTEGN